MQSHDRFAKEFEVLGGHLGNARKKYEDAERILGRFEDELIRVHGGQEELLIRVAVEESLGGK